MNQCQCTTLHCMSYRLYVCVQPSSTAKVPCAAWRSHRNHRYASPLRKFDVWESTRVNIENVNLWSLNHSKGQRLVVQGVVFNFLTNPVSVLRQKFAISLVILPCVFKIFTAKLSLGFLSKGNFEFFPQNCRWDFQQGKLNIFSAKLSLAIFWHLRSKPRWRFLQ